MAELAGRMITVALVVVPGPEGTVTLVRQDVGRFHAQADGDGEVCVMGEASGVDEFIRRDGRAGRGLVAAGARG